MRVVLVSALRDEGPYVLEWIAHHRAAGVTDFLLYTNDCRDGTDRLLEALSPAGVTHAPNEPPPGKSIQWNALKAAWAHPLRKSADWMLCIDSDEFLNLRAPLTSVGDLIEAAGAPDAIVLPWRLFGHSGQEGLGHGLTTRTFTRAAPPGCDYPVTARQFKTLFRAKGSFRQLGVHRPRRKPSAPAPRWADGSGRPMPASFAEAEQRINLWGLPEASDLVQLNHYSVRSAEGFLIKRARGLPNRRDRVIGMKYWVERNFNTVEDVSIARMEPAMRAELERLRALPGVTELHKAALDWHRERLAELLRDEANVQLLGRLLLAATSVPLSASSAQRMIDLYRAAHA